MTKPKPPLPFPLRRSDAHKGDFGRVLLIGGSRGMAGSIALASIAALKSGSGLVSVAVPDRCLETVAGYHPGIMTIPVADSGEGQFGLLAQLPAIETFDAIGCGPGARTGAGAIRIVESLLHRTGTMRVFDADAINVMAQHQMFDSPALPRDQSTLILTPHPGELARLTGVGPGDRQAQINAATTLVEKYHLTVVVKGGPTVVVGRPDINTDDVRSRDGLPIQRYVNGTGNPGMATAGSGDVLTGIITSLLGQGLSPWDAARLGVYVHGLAGDLAAVKASQPGMTCLELLDCIPAAIGAIAPCTTEASKGD
ncbi:MAG: NAD(P)H-hydrate dehydratase [Planctomycetales bacterium]|nr:NAD(P)H-hydrate dehydratase [Planctomycetales bacterium]